MKDAGVLGADVVETLSRTGYSDKAIELLRDRPGMGTLENADQVTEIVGPCGDTMTIYLAVDDEWIRDARIQVLGCPGAVASGCAVVSLARGKSLEQARNLTLDDLYAEVQKLPDKKVHCARLALKTLHKAVEEYRNSQDEKGREE